MNVEVYNSESFKTVADSIREKVSTENKLSFPNEFLKNIRNCKDSLVKRFTLESYSSDKVVSIPPYAFYQSKIEEINFPNVTEIGKYAFANCNNLSDFDFSKISIIKNSAFSNTQLSSIISSSIKTIEDYAFSGSQISKAELPNLETLGSSVFSSSYLQQLIIPKVKEIPQYSFRNYRKLKVLKGDSIEIIGGYAFKDNSRLREIYLPEVLEIGRQGFRYCTSLTKVELPKVKKIGDVWGGNGGDFCTFDGCTELVEFHAPLLETCGQYLFRGCSKLETINCPNLGGSPGSGTFDGCMSLKKVILPKIQTTPWLLFTNLRILDKLNLPGVETALSGGIKDCYVLEEIDFTSITTIQQNAIQNCPLFKTLIIRKPDQICTLEHSGAFPNSKMANGQGYIYVPDNLVNDYKEATNWSVYANQIKPLSEYLYCDEIILNYNEYTISNNQPIVLTATLFPENTVEKLSWESSDMSVAYILNDGTVIPKKNGTTIITAKCGETIATCNITVNNIEQNNFENTIYQLSEGANFTGENYIDTGIQLAKEDKDFTIMADITTDKGNGQFKTIFHCAWDGNGFFEGYTFDINGIDNIRFCQWSGGTKELNIPNKTQVSNFKVVITHEAHTSLATVKYLYNGVLTTINTNSFTWTSIPYNLYLGCMRSDDMLGRFWKGAIHEFALFDYVKSDEEIAAYLS